jgi:hypothetical protein
MQLKKVHWRGSCAVLTVKVGWVTSIGQASNAVVGAGSPQPFSCIEAEWTSAVSNILRAKVFLCQSSKGKSGHYLLSVIIFFNFR